MPWLMPIFGIIACLGLIVVILGTRSNGHITTTVYTIENDKLDPAFDTYTIAQVSDLHNAEFGLSIDELIESVKASDPDLIVMTGDMIGNWVKDYDKALAFIKEAKTIAPVIVVDGNHDAQEFTYGFQKQAMIDAGAIVLEDQAMTLLIGESSIHLIGMKERFGILDRGSPIQSLIDPEVFNLVLAHHPESFLDYVGIKADLVLTGHAHGGQFRFFGIPIYSPDQGLFPKYTSGIFTLDQTSMVISRGLGESVLPLRLFNPPELVILKLQSR